MGSIEGTVEEVGMRATRLRTPAQSVAYIPNGDLSNQIIDNFGLRIYRRWKWTMGVEYGTSPKVLEEFALRSKEIKMTNVLRVALFKKDLLYNRQCQIIVVVKLMMGVLINPHKELQNL